MPPAAGANGPYSFASSLLQRSDSRSSSCASLHTALPEVPNPGCPAASSDLPTGPHQGSAPPASPHTNGQRQAGSSDAEAAEHTLHSREPPRIAAVASAVQGQAGRNAAVKLEGNSSEPERSMNGRSMHGKLGLPMEPLHSPFSDAPLLSLGQSAQHDGHSEVEAAAVRSGSSELRTRRGGSLQNGMGESDRHSESNKKMQVQSAKSDHLAEALRRMSMHASQQLQEQARQLLQRGNSPKAT